MMNNPVQLRPDVEALSLIDAVARRLRAALGARLPSGLTLTEFQVLQQLEAAPRAPAELARALSLTKGALTPVLQGLQSRGWIRVETDVLDGRRRRVSLTPAGAQARSAAFKALKAPLQAIRAAASPAAFAEAVDLLRRLEAALAQVSQPAGPEGASRP